MVLKTDLPNVFRPLITVTNLFLLREVRLIVIFGLSFDDNFCPTALSGLDAPLPPLF